MALMTLSYDSRCGYERKTTLTLIANSALALSVAGNSIMLFSSILMIILSLTHPHNELLMLGALNQIIP
jgi:hypothetical protein